ncbi:MAG: methionyl-tRNA formyltransferase, partial [Candidatus Neomarinimicrobiota bacterium]
IKPRVDTGDILLQTSVPIHPEDTYGSLAATLATVGADLLVETLDRLESGTVTPVPQSTAGVSRAPKITPEMQILRWDRSAESLRGWIRALSPRPEAYTILRGKRIGITRASVVPEKGGEAPGTVVKVSPGICWVQTGEGLLAVEEVHPQGKRVMSIRDYLAGRPLSAGDRFET